MIPTAEQQRFRRLADDAHDVTLALVEVFPELACACGVEPDAACVLHGGDCIVCGAFPGELCDCTDEPREAVAP